MQKTSTHLAFSSLKWSTVVEPPGTSTVIGTLHTLFPLLRGGSRRLGIVKPPRTHAKDLYTPCFLFTEVVREGSRRFAAVEPPGTSTVIGTLHTLFPLLRGGSRRFSIFEPPRTHAKDLYTPCYLCTEVVREGSRRFAVVKPPGTSV